MSWHRRRSPNSSPFRRARQNRRLAIERLERRFLLTAYTWQNAAIGGGGFVDGIFYDPHNQNVIYARTDIGGLYKTVDDGANWTQLLDFVGNNTASSDNGTQFQEMGVLSFAIDPQNSNNLYADVGEYSGTNGAVFYSTDAGRTWDPTNLPFYVGGNSNGRATGERIAVDPYNSNIVLLASNANGLWKSTNAGHTFSQVSSFSTASSINFVLFDPYGGTPGSATQNIFVGVNSTAGLSPQTVGIPEPTNLWRTSDGGTSWSQVAGSSTSPGRNINVTLSSLSRSDTTATATTPSATGIQPGDVVTIAGASPSAFNGTFTVQTTPTATTFTYTVASGTGSATGTITAKVNYSDMPNRAALASDGNLYLAYSNGLAPDGNLTQGGVWRYSTSSGVWANISPDMPGVTLGGFDQFGYVGLALDPQNSTTVVVTSFDRYAAGDAIWRTTNASAASPVWTALFQFQGYGGGNTTRNTSTAPWVAAFDDGIGNWAGSVAVNPFNSAQIMYGTGQGIWATNNGTSNMTLTAPNSWYFPDTGIEFTAVGSVAAPTSGVPIYSAMGDIGGFAHTTLTASAAQGSVGGSGYSTDYAGTLPTAAVIVGSMGTNNGVYTTNGSTFTAFASNPGGGTKFRQGTVAISADGATIVWAPSGHAAYYSTNHGSSWTLATLVGGGSLPTGGTIVADKVNSNYFYYWTENGSDNVWTLYISSDAGHTFSASAGGTLATGNPSLAANPYVAGDLWLSTYIGLYHSTNFGASFAHSGVTSMNGNWGTMGLGAAALGTGAPAVYVFGTLNNFQGVYRSDDAGGSWVLLNDKSHQWGGLIQSVAADPNVFGRVYLGINGRGIIIGNPANSLPAAWIDADINSPGNPGWASRSTTLSSGTVINQWTVNGGGAGISGTSDQFNFAYQPISGSAVISAQLTALTNADGGSGTPEAGLMMRAGQGPSDPFVALVQTAGNTLMFKYRTASGGSVTSSSLGGIPIGAEYVRLVNNGNSFTGYYSADGAAWSQLGSTIAMPGMPPTYDVGLTATDGYNSQLTSGKFAQVAVWPQGDINGDGQRDITDLQAMMTAMSDLSRYQTQRTLAGADLLAIADLTRDGQVTNADIQPLINLLAAAVPAAQSDVSSFAPETPSQDRVSNTGGAEGAPSPPAPSLPADEADPAVATFQHPTQAINGQNIILESPATSAAKPTQRSTIIDRVVSKKLPAIDGRFLPIALHRSHHSHFAGPVRSSAFDQFFANLSHDP